MSLRYFKEGRDSSLESLCSFKEYKEISVDHTLMNRRSQWRRDLRRRSAAARLLTLWVRIPPEAWMSVCCECCVWSGRGLCDSLITRPEESYRLWCVVVCGMKTSRMRPWPSLGRRAAGKMQYVGVYCLGEVLCYTMKYGTKRNFIIGICFLKTKN